MRGGASRETCLVILSFKLQKNAFENGIGPGAENDALIQHNIRAISALPLIFILHILVTGTYFKCNQFFKAM